MASIDIIDEAQKLSQDQIDMILDLLALASKTIQRQGDFELDISIVDNPTIHQLNKDYRGIDRPTDVLSFAMEDMVEADDFPAIIFPEGELRPHLGDIIISYDKIIEQAEEYQHSFERELGFLVVHGFLHLNGYDHQTAEEEEEMFAIQEEVLKQYGLER